MSEQVAREGFGELNTSPYYWIFTSVSVGSIPCHYSVAEPGEVPGGPPSPLIFRPNWGPKGPKKIFFEIAPSPPPPTLSQGLDERPPPPLSEGLDPPPLLTYSFPLRCKCLFKLHQSVAQNLSSMWRSTFELGASQRRSVTKFAPKSYLSGMVFVLGQELTGKVWSKPWIDLVTVFDAILTSSRPLCLFPVAVEFVSFQCKNVRALHVWILFWFW